MSLTLKKYHYLALGDSYTIGEQVAFEDNFPNQVAKILKSGTTEIDTQIIARTGWTTDELIGGIEAVQESEMLRPYYDFVTLLIGVNNQYRGRTPENYRTEFEALLKKAIVLAGNHTKKIIVLSIPDWGVTPFASGRDRVQIAREIDVFNNINRQLASGYHIMYMDITEWTREAANDPTLLAPDGLHPSGKEYKRWAEKISAYFRTMV